MDASHVYVRVLALGCFYSHINTRTFRRALRGDKECPFGGVTKSGSLEEGAGKRCSECDFIAEVTVTKGAREMMLLTELRR